MVSFGAKVRKSGCPPVLLCQELGLVGAWGPWSHLGEPPFRGALPVPQLLLPLTVPRHWTRHRRCARCWCYCCGPGCPGCPCCLSKPRPSIHSSIRPSVCLSVCPPPQPPAPSLAHPLARGRGRAPCCLPGAPPALLFPSIAPAMPGAPPCSELWLQRQIGEIFPRR